MSIFGDRVRDYRLRARLKQADFLKFGVTQSQLSLIENGDIVPSVSKIDCLARALNVGAVDLVVATEVEGKYFGERLSADEVTVVVESARLTRSQAFVATDEAYRRIATFCTLWYADRARVAIDEEAHYQRAARIFRRTAESAAAYDSALFERMFVPDSMIGVRDVDSSALGVSLQRSKAYLRSLILEYPDADGESHRAAIVERLGLTAIDDYLTRIVDAAGAAATYRPRRRVGARSALGVDQAGTPSGGFAAKNAS